MLFKLACAFGIALLPVLVMLLWGVNSDVRFAELNVVQDQVLTADAIALQVEESFDAALGLAWAVSNDPTSQQLPSPDLDVHLQGLIKRISRFDAIGVFDTQGNNRGWGSTEPAQETRPNISQASYFRAVLGTNAPVISEVIKLGSGQDFGIVAAVPMRGPRDQLTGAVIVVMKATRLSKQYNETKLQPGQNILLVDRNGRLAFHSALRFLSFEQTSLYAGIPSVRRALSGTPQTITDFQSPVQKDTRIGAFVPTPAYRWAVGVTIPRKVALAPMRAALIRQLLGFCASLLLSGIIAVLFARHLTAPLSRLRSHAQALGRGDLSRRVTVETGDELEELADAVNEMAFQIQDRDTHLRISQERFRATFEQAAVGIAHLDFTGSWVRVNDRLCEIVGHSRDELLHKSFQEITHPSDQPAALEASLQLREGKIKKSIQERRCLRKDGSVIWTNVTSTLVHHPNTHEAEYVIAVIEDISRRKKIEQERQRAEEEILALNSTLEQRVANRTAELEAANKELEAFSYSVSHDLRSPLRSLNGFSQMLLKDYQDKLDEEGKDYLSRISAASVRMGQLIDDILHLFRVTRAEMKSTLVNLSLLVKEVCGELEDAYPNRQVELVIEPDLLAQADPQLMRVALENLLSNAWKFTSRLAKARIEFGVMTVKGIPTYFVRDNGAGFDMAHSLKLFHAFQRLHAVGEFPGTGIGLATVQRIISRHGGQIWAEAEPERGATFYFTLPTPAQPVVNQPIGR